MKSFLALAIIVLSACASADVMRLDSIHRPAKSPEDVQLLLEQPPVPFTAIALIEVSDQGWGLSLETLRRKLVVEAGKLGGDAVILSRRTTDAGAVLMPVGNQFWAVPFTESGLVGQVVVFAR